MAKWLLVLAILGVVIGVAIAERDTTPKIVLQPYTGVPTEAIKTARVALENATGLEVTVAKSTALPDAAFYRPRNRYRAEKLLTNLDKVEGDKVIGLTLRDISTTKGNVKDWGIMGLGKCPGKTCVVSTFRLKGSDVRLAKVVVHEFGHTLGISHCSTKGCLMADAQGKADTVDRSQWLCDKCLQQAKGLIKKRSGV